MSLITTVLLIIHIGYSAFCYLTLFYDPSLNAWLSYPLMAAVCLHAVLGMASVFLQSDGTRLDLYPEYNRQTILQRLSAALIFPLLILHLNTYDLLSKAQENGYVFLMVLLLIVDLLFYGVIIMHTSVSFSRALITLGILRSRKKQRICDRSAAVVGAIIFIFAAIAITKGRIDIFF